MAAKRNQRRNNYPPKKGMSPSANVILKQEIPNVTTATVKEIKTSSSYRGPIPPPYIMEQYGQIDSTFPDRILAMAEKQSSHRQNLENKLVEAGITESKLGLYCGTFLGSLIILCAFYLILIGKEVSGFALIIPALGALVYGYSKATSDQAKQLENKKDQ